MRKKTRVSILGAGPAGLAAACGLSSTKKLREKYEVTVYQVGWRAGGKCSTGRIKPQNVIDQNCAHYLFGCYDNTFELVRTVYKELTDSGKNPWGDFDESLLPRNLLALKQQFEDEWHTWLMEFPTNSAEPGDKGGEYPGTSAYIEMTLEWMLEAIFGWSMVDRHNKRRVKSYQHNLERPWDAHLQAAPAKLAHHSTALGIRGLHKLSKRRHPRRPWIDMKISQGLKVLRAAVWLMEKPHLKSSLPRQQRWSLFDYGCTIIIGMLEDQVLAPGGFESIDPYDFRVWLKKHGATHYATESPFVTLWYQNSLAYRSGDTNAPELSAAIGLLGQMRACFTYKGSVAYSLQHEIGDTFIGPMYTALRERGVKFNFFHRVRNLVSDKAGTQLERITVERQVELKNGKPDSYRPFTKVKGIPCWPNEPDVNQFSARDKKKYLDGNYNLESFYTQWKGDDFELERGKDFDEVVFALPHGVIPFYCSDLYHKNTVWRELVNRNPGVESQSVRLWFKPDLEGLGWDYPPPIMSGYVTPYCTWEDDSQLIAGQTWKPATQPCVVACVFGPLEAPEFPPGPKDRTYMPAQKMRVDIESTDFCDHLATGVWPKVGSKQCPNGIDPSTLSKSLARPNSGPLERYTMTWPGSLSSRPKACETTIVGVVFAGDWVRNGLEAGSIEGATMAGLQASREICGSPESIIGENDSFG